MKRMWTLILTVLAGLIAAPPVSGQDLSQYRGYSFGMSLGELQAQAGSQRLRTNLVQDEPAMIQEVVWWPWDGLSNSEGLSQILFRFHDDRLYRIKATYERQATRGLTPEDMVEAISELYGPPSRRQAEGDSPIQVDDPTERALARWENTQFSYTLYRSSLSDAYGLVMFAKQLDTAANRAAAALATTAKQDAAAATDARRDRLEELEALRRRNKKAIRP